MVDYEMLREVCENRHKRSEPIEHLSTDANEELGAERYPGDGQSSQDEGRDQLAGLRHVNDYKDDGLCLSIDTFDLHMDMTDIIAEFTILKSLHFAFPMWWGCASQSLVCPNLPHGRGFREGLQHLVSYEKTMSCVILRAGSEEDYAEWLCGRRELGTYAVYTKEKGWRSGMASDREEMIRARAGRF